MNETQDVGTRILDLRDERRWSQVELAKRAGISQTTVVALENGHGKPRMATLRRIARAFQMPVEEIAPKSEAPSRSLYERYTAEAGRWLELAEEDPVAAREQMPALNALLPSAMKHVKRLPEGTEKEAARDNLDELKDNLLTAVGIILQSPNNRGSVNLEDLPERGKPDKRPADTERAEEAS